MTGLLPTAVGDGLAIWVVVFLPLLLIEGLVLTALQARPRPDRAVGEGRVVGPSRGTVGTSRPAQPRFPESPVSASELSSAQEPVTRRVARLAELEAAALAELDRLEREARARIARMRA